MTNNYEKFVTKLKSDQLVAQFKFRFKEQIIVFINNINYETFITYLLIISII